MVEDRDQVGLFCGANPTEAPASATTRRAENIIEAVLWGGSPSSYGDGGLEPFIACYITYNV